MINHVVAYMGKVRMEMKFKSNAKYNEKPETGSIFALNYNLGTEDFEEAVSKTKEVVMREVKKIRENAYRFYSDNNIEFDRY